MSNLFERIGGRAAVTAAVEIFYKKVLADNRIQHFFTNIEMNAQRRKQVLFFTYAFGGPNQYDGQDMRNAHAALISKGLNDSHFDAVAENLQDTLIELKVDPALIKEVLTIAESTRSDVLNK